MGQISVALGRKSVAPGLWSLSPILNVVQNIDLSKVNGLIRSIPKLD